MTHRLPSRSAKVPMPVAAVLAVVTFCCLLNLSAAAQDAPADTRLLRPADRPIELSDELVHDVLTPFQLAMETHNFDHLLDTFDSEATPDFPRIRDQFRAFFRLTDTIKFRYQILQASADHDTATATADVDMDALPADSLPTEQRRSTQMRFQMKRTPKGWRLTALKPMDFFTQ